MLRWNKVLWLDQRRHDLEHPIREFYFCICKYEIIYDIKEPRIKALVKVLRNFQVTEFGVERMNASVTRLRQLNDVIQKRCVIDLTDKQHLKKGSELAPWSPDVIAYNVP